MVYVVDSNFFIQAHRYNYPLDVALSFWEQIRILSNSGLIISIDKVKNEIYGQNDLLEEWCRTNLPEGFFKDTGEIMGQYAQVTAWATSRSNHYKQAAINEFLDADEADAFLIAYGLEDPENRIIVTHEVSDPNNKKKVKIPEGCNGVGVNFLNTIETFRRLGVTF